MAGVAGINAASVRGLVKTIDQTANAIPNAVQQGGTQAAIKVKEAWFAILAANGLPKGSKIARRKWGISDSTYGKSKATATVKITINGPLHLVLGPTKKHPIVAKRLASRRQAQSLWESGAFNQPPVRFGKMSSATGTRRGKNVNVKVAGVKVASYKKAATTFTRSSKGAISYPGSGGPRAYAIHPGTQGKPAAWPAMKKAAAELGPKTLRLEVNKALATNFGKAAKGAASAATGGTLK